MNSWETGSKKKGHLEQWELGKVNPSSQLYGTLITWLFFIFKVQSVTFGIFVKLSRADVEDKHNYRPKKESDDSLNYRYFPR